MLTMCEEIVKIKKKSRKFIEILYFIESVKTFQKYKWNIKKRWKIGNYKKKE